MADKQENGEKGAQQVTDFEDRSRSLWRTFSRNRLAALGLVLLLVVIAVSIAAPLVASQDPLEHSAHNRLEAPTEAHIFGRDTFGRDILSRVLHAGRVSLVVGVSSVLLGILIGTGMGLIAGYSGGWLENVIMRSLDVLMAFPSLLLGLMVLAVLGSGPIKLILAIGMVLSPVFARVTHAATLALKEQEFVEAARSLGASPTRIVLVHLLPNILGEIVVLASLWTATAIRIEASLSFIGLGVSPPTPTWGNMIREGTSHLTNAPWVSIFPGLAILITVLAFNLVGDGLRDILDPRFKQ